MILAEISQSEGVKQSVSGEGHVGKFFKVLADGGGIHSDLELPDGNVVISSTVEGTEKNGVGVTPAVVRKSDEDFSNNCKYNMLL